MSRRSIRSALWARGMVVCATAMGCGPSAAAGSSESGGTSSTSGAEDGGATADGAGPDGGEATGGTTDETAGETATTGGTACGSIDLSDVARGDGGFAIAGEGVSFLGRSLSTAGDVNGDGLADVLVGSLGTEPTGAAYLVFGKADTAAVRLEDLAAGVGGFAIYGESERYAAGSPVSTAGDVNGDGVPDLLVGAIVSPYGYPSGTVYVVLGKANTTAVQLSDVAGGAGGFAIHGEATADYAGVSVSTAGDINGDGVSDLLVGAPCHAGSCLEGTAHGAAYVVFGNADTTAVRLSEVAAGSGGFAIHGAAMGDAAGRRVSAASDVNGDGLPDLLVSAPGADPNGYGSGTVYVVFGKADTTAVELSDVAAGSGGFAIHGAAMQDNAASSVSAAGDMNGDGLADVLVGAVGAEPAGAAYLVFGKRDTGAVELADVAAGIGGFAMHDPSAWAAGRSVSGAGDVNRDGLPDLLVGAPWAEPNDFESGTAYVVFGKRDTAVVRLADVAAGTGGFAMHGADALDSAGYSVSGAGDVDGDGVPDLLVGAPGKDSSKGTAYVVFGGDFSCP